jgi:hypothetical protein
MTTVTHSTPSSDARTAPAPGEGPASAHPIDLDAAERPVGRSAPSSGCCARSAA